MDWGLILADVPTDVQAILTDVVPLGLTVLVSLAAVGIVIRLLRKVGVR